MAFSFATVDKTILEQWSQSNLWGDISSLNEYGPVFKFMDGPPFPSSSNLHLGHLLIGYIKSCVLNYKQMKGFKVINMVGYDCHGLPIEMVVNKILDIKTKDDVYKLGVAKYNQTCRDKINEFTNGWKHIYQRMGRFSNYDDYYQTMDVKFMETVWYVFKTLWSKSLIYKGFRIMPYSVKCTTPLSNFEAGQNHKMIDTTTIFVKFPLVKEPQTSLLIWTTTPWTLPSNLAVCIGPDLHYVKVEYNKEYFILGLDCLSNVFGKKLPPILEQFEGKQLIGNQYIPPFNYFKRDPIEFVVLGDTFVDATSGTGIVHLAPAFGEIDLEVCCTNKLVTKETVGQFCPVSDDGLFNSIVTDYAGQSVLEVNPNIIQDLKKASLLFKTKILNHSYPFCWRTDTPLIYKAVSSYFVNVMAIQEELIKANRDINWIPNNIGTGRFGKWLENTKDWGISRSRFFGTPIPVWSSPDGETSVCVGSIDELVQKAHLSNRPTDIHLESIQDIVIKTDDGQVLKLDSNVFDCWFESGAVPVFQYLDMMTDDSEFMTDFVCEGLDQTRGWFYTLLIESVGLFGKKPFKNCICAGLILGADGKKLSKRLNNFVSPIEILETHGSDTIRLYLIGSSAVHAESIKFSLTDIQDIGKKLFQFYNGFLYTLDHVTKFVEDSNSVFIGPNAMTSSTNIMDIWICSQLGTLCEQIESYMDQYLIYKVPKLIYDFIENWTNWYIKFNRERFKGTVNTHQDRCDAITTLATSLIYFCVITAPFIPFLTEHVMAKLKPKIKLELGSQFNSYSVHLMSYPSSNQFMKNDEISKQLALLQDVSSSIRKIRSRTPELKLAIKLTSVKVPLKSVKIYSNDPDIIQCFDFIQTYLMREEINVLSVELVKSDSYFSYNILPNERELGKKYRGLAPKIKEHLSRLNLTRIEETLKIEVDGQELISLGPDDFQVKKKLNLNLAPLCLVDMTDRFAIVVDCSISEEVEELYLVRLFIGLVQDLRGKTSLKPWNRINIYYKTTDVLTRIIGKYYEMIVTKLLYKVYNLNECTMPDKFIATDQKVLLNHDVFIMLEHQVD